MSPSKSQIYEVLRQQEALIVHFSGCPKGSGVERGDHIYPNDLKFVLDGNAHGGLSCSTVHPTDCFYGIERNATGCIGVLLGLQDAQSLKAVSSDDCGSSENSGIRESSLAKGVTLQSVSESISNRKEGGYNEWIVANYENLGIFAVAPFEVSVICPPVAPPGVPKELLGNEPIHWIKTTTVTEVCRIFSGWNVYGYHEGTLCKWVNGTAQKISHSELYSARAR